MGAAEAGEAAGVAGAAGAAAEAAGTAHKRPQKQRCSECGVLGHRRPQCPGQVRAAEPPVSPGAGLEEAAQSWLGSLNPEETREMAAEMAADWAFLQQADDGPGSQELM